MAHFKAGNRNPARIGSFARREQDFCLLKDMNTRKISWHVRAFGHCDTAVFDQHFSISTQQLILRRTGEGNIARHVPRRRSFMERRASEMIGIFRNPPAPLIFEILDPVDFFLSQAIRIVNEPGTI